MTANVLDPSLAVGWRFKAATPGTLDIVVGVIQPVSFDLDVVQGATLSLPLCGGADAGPVESTREVVKWFQCHQTWWIPDQVTGAPLSRDEVIEAIRDARANAAIPSFDFQAVTPHTLTGAGPIYRGRFLLGNALKVHYQMEHRYLEIDLFGKLVFS